MQSHDDSDDHDDDSDDSDDSDLLPGWLWRSVGRYLSSEFTGRQMISSGFVHTYMCVEHKMQI